MAEQQQSFTPGPWAVCPDDATQVRDADGDLVADCRRFIYTDDGEIDCPDNAANARLIAAAPEMARVLRRIIDNPEARIGGEIRADAIAALASTQAAK